MAAHPPRRKTLIIATSVIATVAAAPLAFGHNQVLGTTPAAGEIVSASPVEVSVVTLEPMLKTAGSEAGFALVVTDDEGLYYGDGCALVEGDELSGLFALGEGGDYTVGYQFVSADAHIVSDQFGFVFQPGPAHQPATGLTTAPVCGEPATPPGDDQGPDLPPPPAQEQPEASSAEAPTPSLEAGPSIVTAIVAAGVAAASLGGVWWIARRRARAS